MIHSSSASPFAAASAVIFDMDGVLIDSEPIHREAGRRVLAAHNVPVSEAENSAFVGRTDVEIFQVLRVRHGLVDDEHALAAQFAACVIPLLEARCTPLPDVREVLTVLLARGYRLALASSATPAVIAATLRGLGVTRFFAPVVSSVEVGRGKPAPDVFLETARRLGMPPRECLVIEDSHNGVLAAKAAGMACVAVPCSVTRNHDVSAADRVVTRLGEVLPWLRAPRARPVGAAPSIRAH